MHWSWPNSAIVRLTMYFQASLRTREGVSGLRGSSGSGLLLALRTVSSSGDSALAVLATFTSKSSRPNPRTVCAALGLFLTPLHHKPAY